MATYKTIPLQDYDQEFQNIARVLFDHVLARSGGSAEKGSYSFRMKDYSRETTAKIVIYQHGCGVQMGGELPWRNDGVYVLVRTTGEFAEALWRDIVPKFPRFASRMRPDENVAIAPNYNERFAYFPVMAGESLDEIATFIAHLVDAANVLGKSHMEGSGLSQG